MRKTGRDIVVPVQKMCLLSEVFVGHFKADQFTPKSRRLFVTGSHLPDDKIWPSGSHASHFSGGRLALFRHPHAALSLGDALWVFHHPDSLLSIEIGC